MRIDPSFGSVFVSPESLRTELKKWISRGRREEKPPGTSGGLAKCIAPEAGANYFLQSCLYVYESGLRPVAPWRKQVRHYREELRTFAGLSNLRLLTTSVRA